MRPLDFEFAAPRRAAGWAGWLLLALAALFVADLGRSYVAVESDIARLETRIARTAPAADTRESVRAASPEEFAQARAVLRRFATPWPALFDAVEAVQLDAISLLAIEPDANTGQVTISGEARSYLAVLTYVARLQEQPGLHRVHLARHDVRESEPRRPVAFAVSAQWRRL